MKEGENSKGDLKLKQEIHRYEKASTSNPKGKGEDGIKERAQQILKHNHPEVGIEADNKWKVINSQHTDIGV